MLALPKLVNKVRTNIKIIKKTQQGAAREDAEADCRGPSVWEKLYSNDGFYISINWMCLHVLVGQNKLF